MATLTSILGADLISNSYPTLNTNYQSLNTAKIETSVLSIDGTFAANSDALIPSQKATKTYVTSVLSATVNTCRTIIPQSNMSSAGTGAGTAIVLSSNTSMALGQVSIPYKMSVNKVSFRRTATGTDSTTYIISLYSEDGQTQLFSVTSATTATANTVYTVSVPSITVNPGVYYLAIQPVQNGSANDINFFNAGAPFQSGQLGTVTSEPVMQGVYTVSAGVAPTTITLSSIVDTSNRTLIVRLDN